MPNIELNIKKYDKYFITPDYNNNNSRSYFKKIEKILEYGVKEYFKEGNSKHHKVKKSKSATGVTETTTEDGQINTPDAATVADNPITLQVSKYEKQSKKCDYLQKQKQLTTNSLYQMFDKLTKSPSVTNTDLSLVQSNFNDLFAIKDADTDCVTKT